MSNPGKNKTSTPPLTYSGLITGTATTLTNHARLAILGIQTSQASRFRESQGCLSSLTNQIVELMSDNLALHNEIVAHTNRNFLSALLNGASDAPELLYYVQFKVPI